MRLLRLDLTQGQKEANDFYVLSQQKLAGKSSFQVADVPPVLKPMGP